MPRAERKLAAAVVENARTYARAAALRRQSLGAADRFYKDLVVYQWRLDAVDAQIAAVDEVTRSIAGSKESAEVAGTVALDDVNFGEATRSLREAVEERCLATIQKQYANAISSLEERASQYAVGVPSSFTGHLERFANKAANRECATELLRSVCRETFIELKVEIASLVRTSASAAGLTSVRTALERRQDFWHRQLEEMWGAWQDVTTRMHNAGDEVIAAWMRLASGIALAIGPQRPREELSACLRPEVDDANGAAPPPSGMIASVLIDALVFVTKIFLEVELCEPLGLRGICVTDEAAAAFTPESREQIFAPVIDALRAAGALHRVGDAILDETGLAGCAGALSADPDEAADAKGFETTAMDAWLTESLVEALCEAAAHGLSQRVRALLRLCATLGGDDLVDGVRAATSQAEPRIGMTALDLALEHGHRRVVWVLVKWPEAARLPEDDTEIPSFCLADYESGTKAEGFGPIGQGTRRAALRKWFLGQDAGEARVRPTIQAVY